MSAFTVTVRRPGQPPFTRRQFGTDSAALSMAAQERFGPCGVTVKPA
ncbi:MAG: hypothetical protein H7Z39_16390 [Burkholderiaceae bacterium]|nr:hypothetical protein [Burkholderiaceae bacterium]